LYRDQSQWSIERLAQLGNSPAHLHLWKLLDQLAAVFWAASRNGIHLPLQSLHDLLDSVHHIGLGNLHLSRYILFSMGEILNMFSLRGDRALCGLMSMLIEDTVHS